MIVVNLLLPFQLAVQSVPRHVKVRGQPLDLIPQLRLVSVIQRPNTSNRTFVYHDPRPELFKLLLVRTSLSYIKS